MFVSQCIARIIRRSQPQHRDEPIESPNNREKRNLSDQQDPARDALCGMRTESVVLNILDLPRKTAISGRQPSLKLPHNCFSEL